MKVTVKSSSEAVAIDDGVFNAVLSVFPEEALLERPTFAAAMQNGHIDFRVLQKECDVVAIPWQLFFLDALSFAREMANIEKNRKAKLTARFLAKRTGSGPVSSKRILDRLLRAQDFLCASREFPANSFLGALKGKGAVSAAREIANHFEIDLAAFRGKPKEGALRYLVSRIEKKQINICQGVLTNKILPQFKGVRAVYKNTSGFVIHDDRVPFIFLPSEVNPDEATGRQIYSLIYLLAHVGLKSYSHIMEKDFTARALAARGLEKSLHDITAEFLLPTDATNNLRKRSISAEMRDQLSRDYKVTPAAVVVTLRRRGVISEQDYTALLPERSNRSKRARMRSAAIDTSVRKFAGLHVFEAINTGIRSKTGLTPIQAQYLIFGSVNKRKFREYRERLGI